MYIHESFDSREARNVRQQELKQEHYDVVTYSDVLDITPEGSEVKKYRTEFIVAYPVNERLYE